MTAIVFDTPGLIDLRAFTTMGLSAKPVSTNPIGYFGTGLKYAIATIVRLGGEPEVWIGEDRHVFTKRSADFRGMKYEQLRMRSERRAWVKSRWMDLPFTTSYGRNWHPWMAFRELEANTRDEGGKTLCVDVPIPIIGGVAGRTRIIVDLPVMVEAWSKRDDVFLPNAVRSGEGVQVVPGRSDRLFWRGLRVADLHKWSLFTYNFLDYLELTEDRTLRYEFMAKSALARWVAVDCEDEGLIKRVVTASNDFWEHELEFDKSIAPSAEFHRVMTSNPKGLSSASLSYYSRHDERVTASTFDPWSLHPVPWSLVGNSVEDAKGVTVFDMPYGYVGRWDLIAGAILRRANLGEAPLPDEEIKGMPGMLHIAEADEGVSS